MCRLVPAPVRGSAAVRSAPEPVHGSISARFAPGSLFLCAILMVGIATASCDPASSGDDPADGEVFVLEGGTVYTSALSPPIVDGVVVVLDGVIEAVGPRGVVQIPQAARRMPATGLTVLPGLWNADVAIPDELLALADTATDEVLAEALEERFNRYGFTTIVETSRAAPELAPLSDRIGVEGVRGPRILAEGPEMGAGFARSVGGTGAGGSMPGEDDPAPEAVRARAADLAERGIGLIPALTRAAYPGSEESPEDVDRRVQASLDEITAFQALDGTLVFGTGSGYVPVYDPSMEYLFLDEAGVEPEAIFASLTANPALRFGHDYTGLLEPGMAADLVLVEGDPLADPTALSRVRWAMRDGYVVFSRLDR